MIKALQNFSGQRSGRFLFWLKICLNIFVCLMKALSFRRNTFPDIKIQDVKTKKINNILTTGYETNVNIMLLLILAIRNRI